MHLLVNALSVTNQSGRQSLLGHLSRVAPWTVGEHRFTVLHHASNEGIARDLGENVAWHECPSYTRHWSGRGIWEHAALPALARRLGADALFMPSGIAVRGVPIPQWVYCLTPWCLVPDLRRTPGERIKASLQRRAYATAMRTADRMLFASDFMHAAYRQNAAADAHSPATVHLGIADRVVEEAAQRPADESRNEHQIVSVSVMGNHKGIETVIEALHLLRTRDGIPAVLKLIGSWPDPVYRSGIERAIESRHLRDAVTICGRVSFDELIRSYATSRVFCLMSWCESFGFPAVEAQAFGTPVVCSNRCAMPEIDGNGGLSRSR